MARSPQSAAVSTGNKQARLLFQKTPSQISELTVNSDGEQESKHQAHHDSSSPARSEASGNEEAKDNNIVSKTILTGDLPSPAENCPNDILQDTLTRWFSSSIGSYSVTRDTDKDGKSTSSSEDKENARPGTLERKSSIGSQLTQWSVRYAQNERQRLRTKVFWQKLRKKANILLAITHKPGKDEINKLDRRVNWIKSVQRLDPRIQIRMYFDEVAREGGPLEDPLATPPDQFDLMRGFMKAAAFTVWRPTSREAIAKMMRGEVTGKGLDVKGKSAKLGKLSSLVPYLQIHDNKHKKRVLQPPRYARIRVYYKTLKCREFAEKELNVTMRKMLEARKSVKLHNRSSIISGQPLIDEYTYQVDDPNIYHLDESGIGLDIPERVFFETYITNQDLERSSEFETGRASIPEFQDMNGATTRKYSGSGPRAVVLQTCTDPVSDGLCPQGLIIAYEEGGKVTPVASDFDCFTVGTRGVAYDSPMPEEQINLMKWLIEKIEQILEQPVNNDSWTSQWLKVMKESSNDGYNPTVPKYGFGDPKSYKIMEGAANRFSPKNGAVRHGAECFNFVFPQELDDKFLVISETLPSNSTVPWVYVGEEELKHMLSDKIDEDYCFPINPKWILADSGWKALWDKMMASTTPNTITSMETWYPKESGIREMIEAVHKKSPNGLVANKTKCTDDDNSGETAMILAQEQLRRHRILRRVRLKIRVALMFRKMGLNKLEEEKEDTTITESESTEPDNHSEKDRNIVEPLAFLLVCLVFTFLCADRRILR